MAKRASQSLTKLESDVMRAVWAAQPEAVRARDVVEAMNQRRKEPLAYTTVQTMLTILAEKGYVEVASTEGRAHCYRARVSHQEASRRLIGDLVERLFEGRPSSLLQMLVDDPDIDEAELLRLRTWVDARLSDRGETRS